MADPDSLPEPGWTIAARLPADVFSTTWAAHDVDVTPGVVKPGQYEVRFQPASGRDTLGIQSVELLIAGRMVPNRVQRLPGRNAFSVYRMEQTTADSPTALRVIGRITGGNPCPGEILGFVKESAER